MILVHGKAAATPGCFGGRRLSLAHPLQLGFAYSCRALSAEHTSVGTADRRGVWPKFLARMLDVHACCILCDPNVGIAGKLRFLLNATFSSMPASWGLEAIEVCRRGGDLTSVCCSRGESMAAPDLSVRFCLVQLEFRMRRSHNVGNCCSRS